MNTETTIIRSIRATGETMVDWQNMLEIHAGLTAEGIDYDWSTADATIDGVPHIVFATGPVTTTFS